MKLMRRIAPETAKANHIWRFYTDAGRQWRWEKLAFDGTVLEQSKVGYPQYEDCLSTACKSGYVLLPSLSTKTETQPRKAKRSYMRLSSR
jgi:hypothetical protein